MSEAGRQGRQGIVRAGRVGTAETRESSTTKDIGDRTGIPKGIPLIRKACLNSQSRFFTRTELGQTEQGKLQLRRGQRQRDSCKSACSVRKYFL
jgi:hypothetical protein